MSKGQKWAEPAHSDWNALSSFQTDLLQQGYVTLYLVQGNGSAFKLNRIESYTVPHLFQTATKHAAIQLGSRFVTVRSVVTKVIQFPDRVARADADGNIDFKIQSSVTGNELCAITCNMNITVSAFRKRVEARLYELGLRTSQMPVVFTDDFMLKNKSGNTQIKSLFKIIKANKGLTNDIVKLVKKVKK